MTDALTEAKGRDGRINPEDYLAQTKEIKKETTRLKKLFQEIDENKKKLVYATIDDVAFLTVSMRELRKNILREGTTVEYQNGENQHGTKQNPDAQLYIQMSRQQTQAMKILLDCMPKKNPSSDKDDGFDDFVAGRK